MATLGNFACFCLATTVEVGVAVGVHVGVARAGVTVAVGVAFGLCRFFLLLGRNDLRAIGVGVAVLTTSGTATVTVGAATAPVPTAVRHAAVHIFAAVACASHIGLKAIRSRSLSRMPAVRQMSPNGISIATRRRRRIERCARAHARQQSRCSVTVPERRTPRSGRRLHLHPRLAAVHVGRRQPVRERAARAGDERLRRVGADVQRVADLLQRPALERAQLQRRALALGQLAHRAHDAVELVRLHRARLGVVRDLGRDARVQRQRVALAPREVQRAPPRDRRQPRAHVGGSRPADQRPVGGEQRLLDGILGQFGTEAPRDVAQQRFPVALHELGERALIARSSAFGEPSIVLVVV